MITYLRLVIEYTASYLIYNETGRFDQTIDYRTFTTIFSCIG